MEPILRNAKVIIPYDVLHSYPDGIDWVQEKVTLQSKIYPEADILGIFLNQSMFVGKTSRKMYDLELEKLKKAYRNKLFDAGVSFHREIPNKWFELRKILFSSKTNISREFSHLADELLKRLGYSKETL